jgi:hypothetical protein
MAAFEDGSDLHGEGLPASVALVGANPSALPVHLGNAGRTATVWTIRTIRPNASLDPAVRGGLGVKPFRVQN